MPGHPADPRRPQRGARAVARRGGRRRRLRGAAEPHPASGSTCGPPAPPRRAAVASGVDVRRMMVVSMLLSGARRRPGRAAAAVRRLPLLRHHVPDRARLHRHRGRAAGPQQPGRASPSAALLFAFLVEQSSLLDIHAGISNDIVSITQGVIVLARRHRLRDRPPLHPGRRAAVRWPSSSPPATRKRRPRHDDRQRRAHPRADRRRPRRRSRRIPVVRLAAGRRSRWSPSRG